MLETLDPSKKLRRKEWDERHEPLYRRLKALQAVACRVGMPVIVLFEGWDVAGKGPCIAALTQALDPRGFKAWPIRSAQAHEVDYPWLWRFWLKLPARGEIAIFDRSWYRRPLVERIEGPLSEEECRLALRDILDLERTLTADGYVLVKIWLHIGQDEQRRRLRVREKHSPGPGRRGAGSKIATTKRICWQQKRPSQARKRPGRRGRSWKLRIRSMPGGRFARRWPQRWLTACRRAALTPSG